MDSIESWKDRESFEGAGSSSPETPAAFGLTGARTFGVGSSFLASLFPLITALSFNFDYVARSMSKPWLNTLMPNPATAFGSFGSVLNHYRSVIWHSMGKQANSSKARNNKKGLNRCYS